MGRNRIQPLGFFQFSGLEKICIDRRVNDLGIAAVIFLNPLGDGLGSSSVGVGAGSSDLVPGAEVGEKRGFG